MRELMIDKQTGQAFKINKGERFSVVDIEGQQVADLFAVNASAFDEFFSAPVTIDCKESLFFQRVIFYTAIDIYRYSQS